MNGLMFVGRLVWVIGLVVLLVLVFSGCVSEYKGIVQEVHNDQVLLVGGDVVQGGAFFPELEPGSNVLVRYQGSKGYFVVAVVE